MHKDTYTCINVCMYVVIQELVDARMPWATESADMFAKPFALTCPSVFS